MSTTKADTDVEAPPASPTPLPRAMGLAHAVWAAAGISAIILLLASTPGYAIWLRGEIPITPGPDPVSAFNVLSGLTSLATVLICLSLALVLFLRKRNEPMALFVSFYLMAYGILLAGPLEFLTPLFAGADDLAASVLQPLFLTVPTVALLVFFPDGRPVPRWGRWLILLIAAGVAFSIFFDVASFSSLPAQLMVATVLVVMGLAFAGQIYRYRRVSRPAEREQTRWVVFGLTLWLALLLLDGVPYVYLQSLPPETPPPGWASASASLWWLSLSVFPITLSIAILRYRLYDVDLIINRALVYGALTAILAGLYAASISLFQKLFVALTGQQSDAAIVLTTLILVSAFTPIHTRLKAVVERRFRDVHDPLRLLADFTRRLDSGVWVVDTRLALSRLLAEAVAAFDAASGAAYVQTGDAEAPVATIGDWQGHASLTAPVASNGKVIGRIALGPRRNRAAYTPEDTTALCDATDAVARSLP